MQAHFTQFGRVELDPMRIPTLGDGKPRDDAFARELSSAMERDAKQSAVVDSRSATRASEEACEAADACEAAPQAESPPADTRDTPAQLTPRPDDAAAPPITMAPVDDGVRPQAQPRAREFAAPTAREGVTTVSDATARAALPSVGVAPPVGSAHAVPQGPSPLPLGPATAGTARAPAGGTASESARTPRATATTPATGYRSLDKLALDRLEAARDSVLRQIAFTLKDGTSEARMQLEPPELGQLDMQLIVDATGQTRLTVVAERPEVAALLTQHMPALASALAQQGLTIAHADVKSRDGRPRADLFTDSVRGARRTPATDVDADPRGSRSNTTSFITAAGLDFWV